MSESLCLSCGLCCDGTLFTSVPLRADEVETAQRLRLHVIPRPPDGQGFRQPCAAFEGRCTAYAERPATCRTYRCHLLEAVSGGEASLEEAQDIVRRARELGGTGDAQRLRQWLAVHFTR